MQLFVFQLVSRWTKNIGGKQWCPIIWNDGQRLFPMQKGGLMLLWILEWNWRDWLKTRRRKIKRWHSWPGKLSLDDEGALHVDKWTDSTHSFLYIHVIHMTYCNTLYLYILLYKICYKIIIIMNVCYVTGCTKSHSILHSFLFIFNFQNAVCSHVCIIVIHVHIYIVHVFLVCIPLCTLYACTYIF